MLEEGFDAELAERYNVTVTPTIYVIGPDGDIVANAREHDLRGDSLIKTLAGLLEDVVSLPWTCLPAFFRLDARCAPAMTMALRSALFALALALALSAASPTALSGSSLEQADPDAETIAFIDVAVLPMDREGVLPDQTVLVRGDTIAGIGPASEADLPDGTTTIDGSGHYLMPGLADLHVHLPPRTVPRRAEGGPDDAYTQHLLTLFLAGGVTTVRNMNGHSIHLDLREKLRRGELLGPRLFTAGPQLTEIHQPGDRPPGPDALRRLATRQVEAGYDLLKIGPPLSMNSFRAVMEVADSADVPVAGHVPPDVGLQAALEGGIRSIEHLDGYVAALAPEDERSRGTGWFGLPLTDSADTTQIPALAEKTRRAGTWNVPTQNIVAATRGRGGAAEKRTERPPMQYMPGEVVESWAAVADRLRPDNPSEQENIKRLIDIRQQLIQALREAGAGLLVGTDAPHVFQVPGFSAQEEVRRLAEAGLTAHEALAAGTVEAARFMGAADRWGTVEEGKAADLLLLEGNPLEDLRHLSEQRGGMTRGTWLGASELQERLRAIARWAEDPEF